MIGQEREKKRKKRDVCIVYTVHIVLEAAARDVNP